MSDPVISPDGNFFWNGSNWIPIAKPNGQVQIHDSVIMGNVKNETNISINETNDHAKISNYCDLYIYRISKSDLIGAKEVLEMSKHTNLRITEEVFKNSRLIDVSDQVLFYVKSQVISFVGLAKGFVEQKIDAIQSGHGIIAPVVELMKQHVQEILEFRSSKDSWNLSEVLPMRIETILMEFKQLGLILHEAIKLLQSVSDAIVKSPTAKIARLLSSSEISNLNLQLISITHYDCKVVISDELSALYQKLPNAEFVSEEVRLDSLKNELINLQNEIFTVERLPIRITPMVYSGVLISGEVQLLYQFKELREDLISIIMHVEAPSWDILKHLQIQADGYNIPVACWMGLKDEMHHAIDVNAIELKLNFSFNQKQQFRIMLQSIYNVGETLGKLKKILRPAWGKVDQMTGKYYYELDGQMETVYNICRTTRFAIRKLLRKSDWEEIHTHPEIAKSKPLGLKGENDYKLYNSALGSAPGELGCFIATAAYGSELHWKIDILRYWRDFYLRESKLGRAFIRFYYSVSPRISKVISRSSLLKSITRILLLPVVSLVSLRVRLRN
mgnify:CR=1 FL=1|tara:strand:+ start:185 stop:1861 length:1677 start_codon:yes stop_codon:yes gene_type:complete